MTHHEAQFYSQAQKPWIIRRLNQLKLYLPMSHVLTASQWLSLVTAPSGPRLTLTIFKVDKLIYFEKVLLYLIMFLASLLQLNTFEHCNLLSQLFSLLSNFRFKVRSTPQQAHAVAQADTCSGMAVQVWVGKCQSGSPFMVAFGRVCGKSNEFEWVCGETGWAAAKKCFPGARELPGATVAGEEKFKTPTSIHRLRRG